MLKRKLQAFTLLEMVVVLGLFLSVTFLLLPVTINKIQGNKLDKEATNLLSYLFVQQQNSYSSYQDKSYGISLAPDKFIIYSGNSLGTADSVETIILNPVNQISQMNLSDSATEIHFAKGSFRPDHSGYLDISNQSKKYRININPEGLITISTI
ncbi:MAG: type II secretion system protein [bacterium]